MEEADGVSARRAKDGSLRRLLLIVDPLLSVRVTDRSPASPPLCTLVMFGGRTHRRGKGLLLEVRRLLRDKDQCSDVDFPPPPESLSFVSSLLSGLRLNSSLGLSTRPPSAGEGGEAPRTVLSPTPA